MAGGDRLEMVKSQPAELGMLDRLGSDLRVQHLVTAPEQFVPADGATRSTLARTWSARPESNSRRSTGPSLR
jgi:hypothetical protein